MSLKIRNIIISVIGFVLTLLLSFDLFPLGLKGEFIANSLIYDWTSAAFISRILLGSIWFLWASFLIKRFSFIPQLLQYLFAIGLFFLMSSWAFETSVFLELSSKTILLFYVWFFWLFIQLFLTVFKKPFSKSLQWGVSIITLVTGLTFVFVKSPIFLEEITFNTGEVTEEIKKEHPLTITDQNTHLYIYASTGCPYCMNAIKRTDLALEGSDLKDKVLVRFIGEQEDAEWVMDRYLESDLDYLIYDKETFFKENGYSFPKVYLLKSGKFKGYWESGTYNYAVLNNLDEILLEK